MALGWDDLAFGAIIAGEWVYHRYFEDQPAPQSVNQIQIPRVDDGAPYPIVYGTVLVKSPVLAWIDKGMFQQLHESTTDSWHYFASMLMVIGIPFNQGNQKLLSMYIGDTKLISGGGYRLDQLVGNGSDYGVRQAIVELGTIPGNSQWPANAFGMVEFLDGNATQLLSQQSSPYTALSYAGLHMNNVTSPSANLEKLYGTIDPRDTPGYRGVLSAFLFHNVSTGGGYTLNHWCLGSTASVSGYGFEIQTLPSSFLGPNQQVSVADGDIYRQFGDVNPIDVIYDILTGTNGKLALPTSRVNLTNFAAAARTLDTEGHGFSRSFEGGQTAGEMIQEILRQIDAVMYEDPLTGLINITLIRNDYTPTSLPKIDPSNCEKLQNFAVGGWTGIPNKVVITYTNRGDQYREASAVAQNQANAAAQDGEIRVVTLNMPGICSQGVALNVASRELTARSRPLMKCSAIVNRTFYAVNPGDCVMLSWPEWGISNVVFRVANVSRGTLEDGRVKLDLIQDYYFVWRAQPPTAVKRPPNSGTHTGAF